MKLSTYEASLLYAEKGLHVIPIAYGDKKPVIKDWVENSTVDKEQLKAWFSEDELNIGVVTGEKSNIIVIDIDTKTDGDGRQSVALQESKIGFLPPTVTARTQRGGLHLFYRYPKGIGKITGKIGLLPNVDIRADGNQVVVFPSEGEHGSYTWITPPWTQGFAPLPKAWVNFIIGDFDSSIKIPKRAFRLPDTIPHGVRHSTLLSYACSLSAKGVTPTELSGAIRETNRTLCNPPITDESELENIITWAIEKTSEEREVDRGGLPQWIAISTTGVQSVDETIFVEWYKKEYELLCINGLFYDENGVVPTDSVKQHIQRLIGQYVSTGLSGKVNSLTESLKNQCYFVPPKPQYNVVNLQNTSLKIEADKVTEIDPPFTLNRLKVEYDSTLTSPLWDKFLGELFEDDDIITLQEYIGYSLLPTTISQKALFMVGKGGEGKSVVGEVVQALFGTSMVQGELHKIQENRFMLAQLENKLLFYDDDLQTVALNDTGTFKKLVTATIPVLVERKGEPHYEMLPYTRILASGNKGLEACYDHSDGFYRRLLILKCKNKPLDRVDDRTLAKKIISKELGGILNWAIEGAQRLIGQNWEFTISESTTAMMEQAIEDANSFLAFINSPNTVLFAQGATVTSSDLYTTYERWCEDNALKPLAMRTVSNWLKENAPLYQIEYSNRVNGRRGYIGMALMNPVPRAGTFTITKSEEK